MYSVVIPVFNSEKTLDTLYERIRDVFDDVLKLEFELVLVDDSSVDDSYAAMESLREKDSRVKIFQLSNNFGQHCALMCGLAQAAGDYVITMDDDLQNPPEEIPKLVCEINSRKDLDVVIGRYGAKKHSLLRNFGSYVARKVFYLTYNKKLNVALTSFRIMRKYVAEAVAGMRVSSPRIGYLLFDVTNRIGNVTVEHHERLHGKSGYTFKMLARDLMSNLYANSVFPLIAVRNIGILASLCSLGGTVYFLARYFLVGVGVQGWTTLVLITTFFSGMILLSLGIVGEYLMRLFNEAKKKPNYVIRGVIK